MARLVILLAIIGAGYWYWTEHHQEPAVTSQAERLQENAAIMQRCIKQEERMQSAGGLAGVGDVGSAGTDAEKLCAQKNNLHWQDGNWYSGSY
jgi:hypothetical protein